MNLLFETDEKDINIKVYWDYDTVDLDTFTDCSITRKRIECGEYLVTYVKVIVDCQGFKYENAVGGIIIGHLNELKQEIEDQSLVADTVDEFKTKLKNLVSIL